MNKKKAKKQTKNQIPKIRKREARPSNNIEYRHKFTHFLTKKILVKTIISSFLSKRYL